MRLNLRKLLLYFVKAWVALAVEYVGNGGRLGLHERGESPLRLAALAELVNKPALIDLADFLSPQTAWNYIPSS